MSDAVFVAQSFDLLEGVSRHETADDVGIADPRPPFPLRHNGLWHVVHDKTMPFHGGNSGVAELADARLELLTRVARCLEKLRP
jgi:hypothetical protein